jgi:DNA-binding beta-propeller fold protein YncE
MRQRSPQAALGLVRTIPLTGFDGPISLAIDLTHDRLLVGPAAGNFVEVVDLQIGAVIRRVGGVDGPRGMLAIPGARRIAVTNGQGGTIAWLDATDLRLLATSKLGPDADQLRWETHARRVIAGYGGGALAAVDPADGDVLAEARLAGHPASFHLERSGSRVFVVVPSANHIAVVDRNVMRVVATWPVTGAKASGSMVADEGNHRLFVACREPARILVYETAEGAAVGTFDCVGDVGALFYDELSERLYVSGGEGFVEVFEEEKASGRFARIVRMATAPGAGTSLFVPEENRLYVAVPRRGGQPVEVRVYEPI